MVPGKLRLLFQATIERKRYFRRFAWWLLGAVAAGGAAVALNVAAGRGVADPQLLRIGQWVAVIVVVLAVLRALLNLLAGVRRRNETLRFFDRGFTWQRGKQEHKYSWGQLVAFREGVRDLSIAGRPLLQRGAHEFRMHDGKVFRVSGVHGDMRQFARAVRPYIADVTGTRMGQALRNRKAVRLYEDLVVSAAGLSAGQHKIPWSELDVSVKHGRLILSRKNPAGKFRPVKTYPVYRVDNLGGFMDVATSTIKNHQPERFNIKTQGPPRYG